MKITKSITGLRRYLKQYSGFSGKTINSVIFALGFHALHCTQNEIDEISNIFLKCSKYGAHNDCTGFFYFDETISFFKKNRADIVNQMENLAEEIGTDIISMVQNFNTFRNKEKPTVSQVGKALWDKSKTYDELTELYNIFALYTLEEISHTWANYIEDNQKVKETLAA